MVEPPEFVRRLAHDPDLARQSAFALFVLTYLEAAGLSSGDPPLRDRVEVVLAANRHLLSAFEPPSARDSLALVDPDGARDLAAWARAQRLEREAPQVAYELGLLALGVALPPVLVRDLRELDLRPDTTVAELPDGSGYPTIFLSTLHPQWRAADHATLFAVSTDARQLAAWAILLLSRRLAPPPHAIVHFPANLPQPLDERTFEVALHYNPVPSLDPHRAIRATRHILV